MSDRLPVKIDSTTNGEYFPKPLGARLRHQLEQIQLRATTAAQRLAMSRRDYLSSSAGAAAVLLGLNQLGCRGGRYDLPQESAHDQAAAAAALTGPEIVFDVQTHHVDGGRHWWETDRPNLGDFLKTTPQAECGAPHWSQCFVDDAYIREIFLHSETRIAVISALWGDPNPISTEEAARTRDRVHALGKGKRCFIHGGLYPNTMAPDRLREEMQALAESWDISAWKLYPVWGPQRVGYYLDDDVGQATIARGIELKRPLFAVHKGLPLAGMEPEYTRPRDVGPAAKMFPAATFLIYHSGYEDDHTEGPHDPESEVGVDGLINSLRKSGIGKDGNVYAELGSVWREVMKDPDQAAHVLGKLLVHLGEDRILWGTDGIWYGSPQDQIQAFRTFEITPELQEKHAYPPLTKAIKRKIFGENAARVYGVDLAVDYADEVDQLKRDHLHDLRPTFATYGPRTRREMWSLLRSGHG